MGNIENTPLSNARYSGALADEINRLNKELKKYKMMLSFTIQDICDYKYTTEKKIYTIEEAQEQYESLYRQIIDL